MVWGNVSCIGTCDGWSVWRNMWRSMWRRMVVWERQFRRVSPNTNLLMMRVIRMLLSVLTWCPHIHIHIQNQKGEYQMLWLLIRVPMCYPHLQILVPTWYPHLHIHIQNRNRKQGTTLIIWQTSPIRLLIILSISVPTWCPHLHIHVQNQKRKAPNNLIADQDCLSANRTPPHRKHYHGWLDWPCAMTSCPARSFINSHSSHEEVTDLHWSSDFHEYNIMPISQVLH